MKTLAFALVVAGLAFAASSAAAQQTSYTIVSATGNTWTLEGQTQTNPTLVVPASTSITLTAKNADGGFHDIKVGDQKKDLNEEGQVQTITFTSPATGSIEYICTIHPTTMKGKISVQGAETTDGDKESPGLAVFGVGLALVGAALLARRK